MIMLDATSDADNVAAVAGRPVDDRTPAGRLEGAHQVVQITDDITRGASSRTVAGIVDAFLVANPAVTRLGMAPGTNLPSAARSAYQSKRKMPCE